MSETQWSVEAVLASLDAQATALREREAFHAAQEAHHREQRTVYAAELAETDRRLVAFRAAAAEAVELAARRPLPDTTAATAQVEQADLGSASRPRLGRMIALLLAGKDSAAPFGPAGLAREANRRFAGRLRRSVTTGQVSVVLRRMHRQGKIDLSREGRPHREALYVRKQAVV